MAKMQKQKGNSDCGVFAIAATTSLADGIDPVNCNFQLSVIRQQLSQCLETKTMTLFPTEDSTN